MDFPYPDDFSKQARNRVEAEELRASEELEERLALEPQAGFTKYRHDLCSFFYYICCVVWAFEREALELGKQGIWDIARIRREVDEFLRQFTIEANFKRGHDRFGKRFFPISSLSHDRDYDRLLSEVKRFFYNSKHSRSKQFTAELLALDEPQAAQELEPKGTAAAAIDPPGQAGLQGAADLPPDPQATLATTQATAPKSKDTAGAQPKFPTKFASWLHDRLLERGFLPQGRQCNNCSTCRPDPHLP